MSTQGYANSYVNGRLKVEVDLNNYVMLFI